MFLRRMLGIQAPAAPPDAPAGGPADAAADTEAVRRIVAQLEAMDPERARFLAGFAYVLSRAAQADLDITAEETALMERIVTEHGGLTEAQAVVVVEIAKTEARLVGGTDDYLVTREFVARSTEDERLTLLRCCYLVDAIDESIAAEESAVLSEIANELGIPDRQITALRTEFTDRFAAVRALRAQAR